MKFSKKWSHAVVILLVSNDLAGKLVKHHFSLKLWKKSVQGVVALSPNQSAKLGIYTINTQVIVVHAFGINGFFVPPLYFLNFHLLAHHVSDNMIVYVHESLYVCVVSAVKSPVIPSHRSTV